MRIIVNNIADKGIWETPDPILASNTDIENLKSISRSRVIRTNVTGIQTLKLRMGTASAVSGIVLGRHTLPSGTKIKIYLYDNLVWAGPEIYYSEELTITQEDAGNTQIAWDAFLGNTQSISDMSQEFKAACNWVHWVSTGTINNVLSIKIEIDLTGLNNIEIGRLIIGEYIEPKIGASFNHLLSWEEDTKQYRTEGSTLRSDISNPLRKLIFSLDAIQASDREALIDGFSLVGKEKDFYISMFNTVANYSGIMKLTKSPIMTEFGPSIYKSKYEMTEV